MRIYRVSEKGFNGFYFWTNGIEDKNYPFSIGQSVKYVALLLGHLVYYSLKKFKSNAQKGATIPVEGAYSSTYMQLKVDNES